MGKCWLSLSFSLFLFYSLSLSLSLFLSNDVFFFELFEHVNLTYFLCVLILNPVYFSMHSRHLFCCLVAAENETRPGSLIKCPSACVCVCVCVCGCVGVCVCACVCVGTHHTAVSRPSRHALSVTRLHTPCTDAPRLQHFTVFSLSYFLYLLSYMCVYVCACVYVLM